MHVKPWHYWYNAWWCHEAVPGDFTRKDLVMSQECQYFLKRVGGNLVLGQSPAVKGWSPMAPNMTWDYFFPLLQWRNRHFGQPSNAFPPPNITRGNGFFLMILLFINKGHNLSRMSSVQTPLGLTVLLTLIFMCTAVKETNICKACGWLYWLPRVLGGCIM